MSPRTRNLAIYMACHHSPYAAEYLPPVGDMFVDLLSPTMPDWHMKVYDVVEQEYPDSLEQIDAVVITGSPASTYDDEIWIARLHEQTRRVVECQIPLVGVCFGHQIIASALGGQVERAQVGWGLKLKPVQFEHRDWMKPQKNTLNLTHVHQDQVTRLPTGARILAGNQFCPISSFEIGDKVMTIQGHPEFTNDALKVLCDELQERVPAEVWHQAVDSTTAPNDGAVFSQWISAFFEKNLAESKRSPKPD